MKPNYGDVTVTVLDNFVAVCEINRAPNNFFDQALIADLADAFEAIDQNPATRAIVLCSQGKHFCAGANFGSSERRQPSDASDANPLYTEAVRLFRAKTPVIAAVQGAAVGGGFGRGKSQFDEVCRYGRLSGGFSRNTADCKLRQIGIYPWIWFDPYPRSNYWPSESEPVVLHRSQNYWPDCF